MESKDCGYWRRPWYVFGQNQRRREGKEMGFAWKGVKSLNHEVESEEGVF